MTFFRYGAAATQAFLWIVLWTLPTDLSVASDQIPGSVPSGVVALIGGMVHTATGPPIENGTVLLEDGKILAVGTGVEILDDYQQIDCAGKQIYPGLFNTVGALGLVEIDAVRATVDLRETGKWNPNVVANAAVNPDSELIPVTRANGVLVALSSPIGGRVSGTASVLQLDGWTIRDMTVSASAGLVVNWPYMRTRRTWDDDDTAEEQVKRRTEDLKSLEEFFSTAAAYAEADTAGTLQQRDLKWDAMLPVMRGEIPVIIQADSTLQIEAAVAFSQRHKIRPIISGGYGAAACVALLKKQNIPVIIAGTLRLPQNRHDGYDAAYTLPKRLFDAGVKYCIGGVGRFSSSNARNLPYHAANAVAFGLDSDEAIRSVTLYPAEILGVADRIGSIEEGKLATLFVSNGDILETETQVERAYIAGRPVDLTSRHTQLYEKYLMKQNSQRQ